ncbi:MAG: hypothetical protein ACC662_09700, partial [Planctomycetota bacterium]
AAAADPAFHEASTALARAPRLGLGGTLAERCRRQSGWKSPPRRGCLRKKCAPILRNSEFLVHLFDIPLSALGEVIALGFDFARPTTFEEPTFEVGDGIVYYAVGHTPSLLWRDATWEIGKALLPFLPAVMAGPEAWDAEPVLRDAIEVREGRILNPKILSHQHREPAFPHAIRGG